MAQEGLDQVRHAFPASGDLSSDQYKLVELDGSDNLQVVGTAGNVGWVLVNKPASSDEFGTVVLGGKAKVEAGGSVDAGDILASNASGQAVTATTTDQVVGIALEDASSGDIFKMIVATGQQN